MFCNCIGSGDSPFFRLFALYSLLSLLSNTREGVIVSIVVKGNIWLWDILSLDKGVVALEKANEEAFELDNSEVDLVPLILQ